MPDLRLSTSPRSDASRTSRGAVTDTRSAMHERHPTSSPARSDMTARPYVLPTQVSPAHVKLLPGRRLKAGGVRETALAASSPAREPPGTSPETRPEPPIEEPLTAQAALTARSRHEGRLETPGQAMDSRLQVVEDALLDLNQDLLAATLQIRHLEEEAQAMSSRSRDSEQGIVAKGDDPERLCALEAARSSCELQLHELLQLCLALDRRASGLEEDLSCVVEEVESRLRRMAAELLDTARLRQAEDPVARLHAPDASLLQLALRGWAATKRAARSAAPLEHQVQATSGSAGDHAEVAELRLSVEILRKDLLHLRVNRDSDAQALQEMQQRATKGEAEAKSVLQSITDLQQALQEVQQHTQKGEVEAKGILQSMTDLQQEAWQEMQQHLTKGKAEAKDVCQHVTDLHQEVQQHTQKGEAEAKGVLQSVTDLQEALREIQRLTTKGEEEAKEVRQNVADLNQEVQQHTQKGEAEAKRILQSVTDLQEALQEMQRHMTKGDGEEKEVRQNVADLHQALQEVQQQTKQSKADTLGLRERIQDLQQEVQQHTQKGEAEAKGVLRSVTDLQEALREMQRQTTKFETEAKDVRQNVTDLYQALQEVQQQTKQCKAGTLGLRERIEDLQQEVQQNTQKGEAEAKGILQSVTGLQEAWQEMQQHVAKGKSETKDVRQNVTDMHQALREVQQQTCQSSADVMDVRKATDDLQQAMQEALQQTKKSEADAKDICQSIKDLQQEVRERTSRSEVDTQNVRKSFADVQQALQEVQQQTCQSGADVMDVRKATDDLQQALQEAVKQTKKSDADAKDICQSIKDLQQEVHEMIGRSEADTQRMCESLADVQQALQEVRQQTCQSGADVMDVRKATDDLQQALQEAVKQTKKSDADAKDICQSIEDLQQEVHERIGRSEADTQRMCESLADVQQALQEVRQQTCQSGADVMDVRKATDDLQQALQEAVKQTKKSDADAKDICQSIKDLEQALQEVRTLAKLQAVEEVAEVQDGWQVTEADSKSGLTQEEVEALQATVASQQQALEDVQLHVLRDGLEELAQVVAAVRHAFGDSEAEVADLSRAREVMEVRITELEKVLAGPRAGVAEEPEASQLLRAAAVPSMSSPARVEGPTGPAPASPRAEELAELKAELKVLTFEARQNRHQGIRSHAELGQALVSIQENRSQNGRACEELQAELQGVAQRCAEVWAEAQQNKDHLAEELAVARYDAGLRKTNEALMLHFPEAAWPAAGFEEAIRLKLLTLTTSPVKVRLQQRQPGLVVEVQGPESALQELQGQAPELELDGLRCLAWRSRPTQSSEEILDEHCGSLLQSFQRELSEERRQRCQELAQLHRALQQQHSQGCLAEELSATAVGEAQASEARLAWAAEEWCSGLSELREALQDADAPSHSREETMVELRAMISLETGEARRQINEMAMQARQHAEMVIDRGGSNLAAEIETVRCQLIETVEDRIELRRQLTDLCHAEPCGLATLRTRVDDTEVQLRGVRLQGQEMAAEVQRLGQLQAHAEQNCQRGIGQLQQAVESLRGEALSRGQRPAAVAGT
ncbi:unnamed protein product [Effrenium voratum]|uniref:Uncharacterized protein n=1 Tax=Effrenium voratum TaxID=2562239 RepID=A0AA36JN53_9DINO|nr:unnamed protein product [Effrenium voratum]